MVECFFMNPERSYEFLQKPLKPPAQFWEIEQFRRAIPRKAVQGDTLYEAGDSACYLWFLTEGWVDFKVTTASGKGAVLRSLSGPSVFGDEVIAGEPVYGTSAIAGTDITTVIVPRDYTRDIAQGYPDVFLYLIQLVAQRTAYMSHRYTLSLYPSAGARSAEAFVTLTARYQGIRRVTEQEIADHAGVSRETVANTISELKDLEIVSGSSLRREEYVIRKPDALQNYIHAHRKSWNHQRANRSWILDKLSSK